MHNTDCRLFRIPPISCFDWFHYPHGLEEFKQDLDKPK